LGSCPGLLYNGGVDLAELAKKHGIRLLLQFGSTVRGHAHARSDLDVAVLLDHVPDSWRRHAELVADLQGTFTQREIDVVILNRADPLLLRKILEACWLLHGEPRALAELKMYGFRRYQDHRRFLRLERDFVARTLGP
jgi:predicted nucleotidyltransferase